MTERSGAILLIESERKRQIEQKSYTAEHDDEHGSYPLAEAAVCYMAPHPVYYKVDYDGGFEFRDPWPFDRQYDKRPRDGDGDGDPVDADDLSAQQRISLWVKAGALIAAAIDAELRRVANSDSEG